MLACHDVKLQLIEVEKLNVCYKPVFVNPVTNFSYVHKTAVKLMAYSCLELWIFKPVRLDVCGSLVLSNLVTYTDSSIKVICFLDKLLQLIGSKCSVYQQPCTVTTRIEGSILEVKSKCSNGHKFTWASSPTIRNSNCRVIYKVFASALFLSGNNYYKIHHFSKILGVECISPTTYFTYPQLFLCPVNYIWFLW